MKQFSTQQVHQKTEQIFCLLFGVESASLTLASSPETISTWDSLQHLTLVLSLEEEFQIQLQSEDVGTMKTLGCVIQVVLSTLGQETGRIIDSANSSQAPADGLKDAAIDAIAA
jgi:acyl carrier protein